MKQTAYKPAWWKTAVASFGILSSTIAVAPMDSFAADTVKVPFFFISILRAVAKPAI